MKKPPLESFKKKRNLNGNQNSKFERSTTEGSLWIGTPTKVQRLAKQESERVHTASMDTVDSAFGSLKLQQSSAKSLALCSDFTQPSENL